MKGIQTRYIRQQKFHNL